jgi:DNA-binding NarL/FixJ family response regulator
MEGRSMPSPIRILIADDHPVVRYGLTQFINAEPDLEVVGEASNGQQTVEKILSLRPHVTLLDMELGESRDVKTLQQIRQVAPDSVVIIYTAFSNTQLIVEAVALGIQGYLLKNSNPEVLINAIRNVHAGGTALEPEITTKLLEHMRGHTNGGGIDEPLTKREQEVLHELVGGKSNRTIAQRLYITERTVKFHVSSILNKLHAKNRTEVVLIAAQTGLIDRHPPRHNMTGAKV